MAKQPRPSACGRGWGSAAEAIAREAVGLAEPTDFPDLQARALLAHAAALAAVGQRTQATELRHRASALYESKGNIVAARKATQLAASVRSGSHPVRAGLLSASR